MQIIDCICFNNEIDLLEARVRYLSAIVDHFVVVESQETHSGLVKPLYSRQFFESRLKDPTDKWIIDKLNFVVASPCDSKDPWVRERHQRDTSLNYCRDHFNDGILFVSDLDEIPSREALLHGRDLAQLNEGDSVVPVSMFLSLFKVNYVNVCGPESEWTGPFFTRLNSEVKSLSSIRRQCQRMDRRQIEDELRFSGWHFSYLGNSQFVREKLQAFAHQEPEVQGASWDIEWLISQRRGPFDSRAPERYRWYVLSAESLRLPDDLIGNDYMRAHLLSDCDTFRELRMGLLAEPLEPNSLSQRLSRLLEKIIK